MGVVATKLMIDAEEVLSEATPSASVPHGFEIPDGFVPATKAQVAYWRQLCGAINARGPRGLGDADWPAELAPTRITLRAMEDRRLACATSTSVASAPRLVDDAVAVARHGRSDASIDRC